MLIQQYCFCENSSTNEKQQVSLRCLHQTVFTEEAYENTSGAQ